MDRTAGEWDGTAGKWDQTLDDFDDFAIFCDFGKFISPQAGGIGLRVTRIGPWMILGCFAILRFFAIFREFGKWVGSRAGGMGLRVTRLGP